MQLSVRDVARMMQVSERVVHRWVAEKNLPAQLVGSQYRFNRSELFEWAAIRKIALPPELVQPGAGESNGESLAAALQSGGALYDLAGADKRAILRAVVERIPLAESTDRPLLLDLFLAREASGSTAVGDGIAIPHPRYPVILSAGGPSVTVAFLRRGLDFGAADRKEVDTLLLLVCPTVRVHLRLLARLAAAVSDQVFRDLLKRRAPVEALANRAGELERGQPERAPGRAGAKEGP